MAVNEEKRKNPILKVISDTYELVFVKKKKITSWISFFIILGLTFLVFNAEAREKADEMLGRSQILQIIGGEGGGDTGYSSSELRDRMEVQDKVSRPGELQEGGSEQIPVSNDLERIVSAISVDLSWQDETDKPGLPRLRRYINQPDTFRVTLTGPNGTVIETRESDSSIGFDIRIEEEDILSNLEEGDYSLTLELVTAGDWEPARGPSLITYNDDSNTYDLVVEITYLEVEEEDN